MKLLVILFLLKFYARINIFRLYPFKFFKGCLPQISLVPLLNILSHMMNVPVLLGETWSPSKLGQCKYQTKWLHCKNNNCSKHIVGKKNWRFWEWMGILWWKMAEIRKTSPPPNQICSIFASPLKPWIVKDLSTSTNRKCWSL